MKSHTKEIIEQMLGSEYWHLNFDFAFRLTNESERGALLIGGNMVEEYLKKLVTVILPLQQKSYKDRLLNYPGPLSSFSGKIELLYAFRIIDEKLYNSLNSLRKIRNDAAHSSHTFSLKQINDKLESIYNFELGFPEVIHKLAFDNLIKSKLIYIKENLEQADLKDYDYKKLWEEHMPNPEENESIQQQLLVWKLAFGLSLVCTKIGILTKEYSELQSSIKIWINYLDDLKEKQALK